MLSISTRIIDNNFYLGTPLNLSEAINEMEAKSICLKVFLNNFSDRSGRWTTALRLQSNHVLWAGVPVTLHKQIL